MNLHWRPPTARLAACCAILVAVALAGCAGGTNGGSSNSPSSGGPGSHSAGNRNGPGRNGGNGGRTKIASIVRFALPPAGQGCTGAKRLAGGGTRIPVTVSVRHSQVAGIANVCIDGKGPFPFLIDTGAQGSVLTTRLATRLGLPKFGPPVVIGGAGCSARAQ